MIFRAGTLRKIRAGALRMFRAGNPGHTLFLNRPGTSADFRTWNIRGSSRLGLYGCSGLELRGCSGPEVRVTRFFKPSRNIHGLPRTEYPRIFRARSSAEFRPGSKKRVTRSSVKYVRHGYGCSAPEVFWSSNGRSVVWWEG